MSWKQIPPPKLTPPGEWESFTYGPDYSGWLLRCGPAFNAHVHAHGPGGEFFTTFNGRPRGVQPNLLRAQALVEEEIINSVRTMLPAYRVIFERVERRGLQNNIAKVTVLHGRKED